MAKSSDWDDGGDQELICWVKRNIFFNQLVGLSFNLDLKYDIPGIPVSFGVMGQMYIKGGTFFWNWHHKVTEMLDGEITTGTQHLLVGDDNHNYAAGLGFGYQFYVMGSWPL